MTNFPLPKIGLRTIKTALSVFICVIIFNLFDRPDPFYACIAAVICTKDTVEGSFKMGISRMLGTTVGGLTAILFIFIDSKLPELPTEGFIVAFGILVSIYICNLFKLKDTAASISCIVLCAIFLNISDTTPYFYAFSRIVDTSIGIIISLIINAILPSHHIQKKEKC